MVVCAQRGPTTVSTFMPSPFDWLKGKSIDDCTGGLWRVGDSLYDLTQFAALHPGGDVWITMSKGTDITELFESSHPNIEKARALLQKYFTKKAIIERNGKALTFEPGGFYDTLRKRAWDVLKVTGTGPTVRMLCIHDTLLVLFLAFLALTVWPAYDGWWLVSGAVCGMFLSFLGSCAHNYFHKRNNWRMYTWDLTPYSSDEWRISHAYSHHMFPNSNNDYEVTVMEPFAYFFPVRKSRVYVVAFALYSHLLFAIAMLLSVSHVVDYHRYRLSSSVWWCAVCDCT